jgi:hypothetical protein
MHRPQRARAKALIVVALAATSLAFTFSVATGTPAGSDAVTPVPSPSFDAGIRPATFAENVTTTTAPAPPISREVAMVGDSIFWGATDLIQARHGVDWTMRIDAVPGATTNEQVGAAAGLAQVTDPVGQLVVELGTNDAHQGRSLDESRRSMEQILALFPEARCIHLVTVTDTLRDTAPGASWTAAVAYNDMLREFTDDPRVHMVEWAALLSANDVRFGGPVGVRSNGALLGDNVHPNPDGQVALSDLVAESLATCDR